MKTTFRFIIAAMAAIAVFSSCQKELANETANKTADGVRTISVQFDNSTKASLSGFTPTFTNNDKIRVSNTEISEECTVSVDGSGNATFTTTLSGALTAIYPSTAAVLSSGEADAPIASSNNFKVLATQDGTVEKAIIASATVAEGVTTATFNGVTALFEITPPSTAKKITVTSLKKVESGSRTGTAADINTEDTGKTVITVGDGSADLPGTIYVALVPGVNLTDLSFDAGEAVGMKGIPTNKLGSYSDQTAANTKYAIGNTNWHPYVEIGGKKWATMNIGATALTGADSYGDLFSWGDVATKSSYGESAYIAPAKSLSSDITPDSGNDVARVKWGGTWRMPTGKEGEFKALKEATYWKWEDSGYYVYVPQTGDAGKVNNESSNTYNKSDALLFFPAAGNSYSDSRSYGGSTGYYWSSTWRNSGFAYNLDFNSSNVNPQADNDRYLGFSVRPVSD